MKLISRKTYKPGILNRIGEWLIKFRTKGPYSHSAILFEPSDGALVAECMPDGKLDPNDAGEYWIAESVWFARIPMKSLRRPGHLGGAAIRRCKPDPKDWDFDSCGQCDPVFAARKAKEDTGLQYDLWAIGNFIYWVINQREERVECSEWAAILLGVNELQAWRFDPNSLPIAVRAFRR